MAIKIQNTLSGEKEEFKPLIGGKVGIYNCGPTVYDTVHIGNLRTFVFYDIVRRVFEYNDYSVTQVMNITDIDDKTIRKSKEKKISLEELTRHYEALFLADLHSLNILAPHKLLRARDHIQEMIKMIVILLEKGIAYNTKDGIYFSIGMSKDYGKLAKLKIESTDTTTLRERISNDEYEKENPRDFALWKFHTEEDGIVYWDALFGKGRPGWHIECSAMSTGALGSTIDIHTGGTDLIFPHHTNEIAQSESATEKPFVNYWIHGAFMNVNDEKMAKSKGNFLKLADIEEAGISPLAFKYWLLTAHYSSQINFSLEAVKSAQNAFIHVVEAFVRLIEMQGEHIHFYFPRYDDTKLDYRGEFKRRVSNDFDIPGAVAVLWDLIRDNSIAKKEKIDLMLDFDRVLGLGFQGILDMKNNGDEEFEKMIPSEVKLIAEAREEMRKRKEWKRADKLREEIEIRGYEVKDTENGFELKRKNKIKT